MAGAKDTLNSMKSTAGVIQKAVLEIADFNSTKVKMNKAQAPSATGGAHNPGTTTGDSGYSSKAVKQYAQANDVEVMGVGKDAFIAFANFKKYRFNCQFNPDEISISGFGGEEIPVQNFRPQDESVPRREAGSLMTSAKTHIEMQFKLIFDKTNIYEAFYTDKFTLSATNVSRTTAKAPKKEKSSIGPVQSQVEALTAVVRDGKKTLARFAWGDMCYEGVINSISAEYVMFDVNCEPIRAYVNVGMILYDEDVAGAHSDIWMKEYLNDIYSIKDANISTVTDDEIGPESSRKVDGLDDMGDTLSSLFNNE